MPGKRKGRYYVIAYGYPEIKVRITHRRFENVEDAMKNAWQVVDKEAMSWQETESKPALMPKIEFRKIHNSVVQAHAAKIKNLNKKEDDEDRNGSR